ncbi:MAG: hypothetical protein LCH79_16170 [Proteobacteria bacterium]|nr:hypothetical protein [Pseudomonadota bacterium]
MGQTVLMRINIAGYAGEPATLYGAYDPGTDVLAIVKIAKEYEGGPRDGFLKITNQQRDAAFDGLFIEEETRDAILAFYDLQALKLLNLQGDAARANPDSRIERDGMDEGGIKFKIHPDASNAQVAVLAACLFAGRQRGYQRTVDFMAELNGLTTI